ncbi:MAG: AMP-binding protein [Marinilabiliaceae bacterium]|nr:AMP-binding protein [Marinilabiliaceae bacterium]
MMMTDCLNYKNYQCLRVNGKSYEGLEQLEQLCKQLASKGEEWSSALAGFLGEWMSDEEYLFIQTSGSTGVPKRIKVQKKAMVASALKTVAFLKLQKNDRALLCLSTQYIAGKMMVVRALVGGLDLIPVAVVSNPVQELEEGVEFAAMVPSQVHAIVEADPSKLNGIKKLIIGGGAVSQSLKEQLTRVDVEAWESYGMTETVSHIALRKIEAGEGDKPFQCLQGIQIDQDDRGCLVIAAPELCDEKLVTNDLVQLQGLNQFVLLGRWDNVLNTGGVKVFPEMIEQKLSGHLVFPFVIVGLPDPYWGQKVVLVIESDDEIDLTDVHFLGLLDKFERPKNVYFISSFPRTSTGKVQRHKVIQRLLEK